MGWRLAADLVFVVHFAFVVFIVIGAILIRWARWIAGLHVASLVYGAAIQTIGFGCPLTPLEQDLLRAGGEAAYDGGFIGHYITPILYPGELTTPAKAVLVLGVAALNLGAYGWLSRSIGRAELVAATPLGRLMRTADINRSRG